jgi:3'(2'), 5'-bisphosphate nucleotidase
VALADLALAAGREIMSVYAEDFATRTKEDATPVTEADEKAERVILAGLAKLDPKTPVISEEAAAKGTIPTVAQRFYLVDPLDGTKEFISRNGEFTVNIALIENGVPVAGVVYAPALHRIFAGDGKLGAAEARTDGIVTASELVWKPVRARKPPADRLTVVASRSHRDQRTDDFLNKIGLHRLVSAGSSLKFCLLATGEADPIPVSAVPWNGILPLAMPCSSPLVGSSTLKRDAPLPMARPNGAMTTRPSSPRPSLSLWLH